MSFAFLHPEFFFWMVLPVLALFYLWITQKSSEHPLFSSKALERLRPPPMTMELSGRNRLFLIAALFLIVAMAGPVAVEEESLETPRSNLLIAIDIAAQSSESFDRSKESAIALILALKGENVGVVAYDTASYVVAPLSRDTVGVSELVRGLEPSVMQMERSDFEGMVGLLKRHYKGDDALILIPIHPTSPLSARHDGDIRIVPMGEGEKNTAVLEAIDVIAKKNAQISSIPLFYYPLGFAMVLILIALSSMSQRRIVPLAAVFLSLVLHDTPVNAGIFDFTILDEAVASYERGEYSKSATLFKAYQQKHDSAQIRYNLANALYRSGRYAEARIWYKTIYTTDLLLREDVRYNLARTIERIGRRQSEPKGEVDNEGVKGQHPVERANPPVKKRVESKNPTRLYRMR